MPEWLADYDFYLRHAAVRDGEWVGFRLAWKGLAGASGLGARPHYSWWPWVLDPADPHDVAQGAWGAREWQLDVAMVAGMVGLTGRRPADGRTHAEMREDLQKFRTLPEIQLQDVDSVVYEVKMVGYEEWDVEGYDSRHQYGGWVARAVLVELSDKEQAAIA